MKAVRIASPWLRFPTCLRACIVRARFASISRFAAVVLYRLALLVVMAVGVGAVAPAQTAHFLMSESILPTPTALNYPAQLAVDTKGNIYIADQDSYRVVKETPGEGGFVETPISTGTGLPYGVAVDQAGDVFIACNNEPYVIKETPTSTGYTQSTFGSNLFASTSLAVDSNGAVYVATYTALMVETPSAGSYVQSQIPLTNTKQPFGVAVDSNLNVYITGMDFNYLGHVWKLTPSIVGYSQVSLATNPSGFGELAVDGAGDIYIANGSYSDILVFTPSAGGFYSSATLPQEQFYFGVLYTHSVAVDVAGNVFFTDYFNQLLVEYSRAGGNAGPFPANAGYPSQYPISEFFTIDTASTLGTEGVISGGAGTPSRDFYDAGTGSCEGGIWSTGDVCSVDVYFQPTAVGDRYGAAVLLDGSGDTIATGYARGIGRGPLANFSPGTDVNENVASNGSAVAADISGNLYTVAPGRSTAFKDAPAGGSNWNEVPVGSGLGSATGIAIDGGGNLYIADQANRQIVKETLSTNGYSQSVIAGSANGLKAPAAVAVDASGNVYVADPGSNAVLKETLLAGTYTQSVLPTSALNQPNGVAVDSIGSVYIADTNNDRVLKETPAGTGYVESAIAAGLSSPTAVAVDAFGNVYISETAAGTVLKETLTAGGYVQSTMASGITPYGLALDSDLNLYIAGSTAQSLIKLDVADGPALTFAATPVGEVSADSPQTVTVVNSGNAALTFPIPSSGNDPSISANFSLNSMSASACPAIASTSSAPGNLPAGTSCTLSISFAPKALGNNSGTLVLTDNNLNAANVTQSIALNGSGATASVGTTTGLGSAPNSSSYGQSVTITATVAQVSGATVPTGTVQFSIDGNAAGSAVTLNGGVATYNASSLTAGMHSIGAVYTPAAGSAFATSSATPLSQAVSQITSTITWATPSAITYGTPLSGTQLDANSTVAGSFNYTPALGTVLPAGPQILSVTFTPADAVDYSMATQTVQLAVNKAAPSITWATPAAIVYGTALSATQLEATASAPGTFAYTPVAGTIPPAGSDTLSVTFTPTDAADYSVATSTMTLTVNNPAPAVLGMTPLFVSMGSPAFTLTVNGSGFVPNSTVYWGATALATLYVNAGQLTAQVPASDVVAAGIVGITVGTPAPGGGTSSNLQFEIDSTTSGFTTPPFFSTISDAVMPGSTATYPVTLPSSAADISATCLNLPVGASCSFSQATGVLTITTSATTPAGTFPITVVFTETLPSAGGGLVLLPFFLLPLARAGKGKAARRMNQTMCLGIVLIAVAASAGCGGGSQAQKGSQTQTVTSSGSVSLTVQ